MLQELNPDAADTCSCGWPLLGHNRKRSNPHLRHHLRHWQSFHHICPLGSMQWVWLSRLDNTGIRLTTCCWPSRTPDCGLCALDVRNKKGTRVCVRVRQRHISCTIAAPRSKCPGRFLETKHPEICHTYFVNSCQAVDEGNTKTPLLPSRFERSAKRYCCTIK